MEEREETEGEQGKEERKRERGRERAAREEGARRTRRMEGSREEGTSGGWEEEGEFARGKNLEMQHGGRESVAIITKGRQLNANTLDRGMREPRGSRATS